MRRAAVAAVAGILFVAACQDTSTAPVMQSQTQSPLLGGISGDNPPPPPIDSGAVGAAQDTQDSNYSQSLAFDVTYFFNQPENSGWLKFKKDQFDTNVDIDNSAAVRLSGGTFSGRGTIQIIGPDRVLVINLAQVSYGKVGESSFGECTVGTPTTTDGATRGCYSLQISGAKFVMNTGEIHDAAPFALIAGPKKECTSREGPCIITPGT
jgi:hypothetical protein